MGGGWGENVLRSLEEAISSFGCEWLYTHPPLLLSHPPPLLVPYSSATDHLTGRKVAIKKVSRAFDDVVDAKRILREIKLLRHFRHENVSVPLPPSLLPSLLHLLRSLSAVRAKLLFEVRSACSPLLPSLPPSLPPLLQIISILDILPLPSLSAFEDVYIVSDLMETDLHRIIYSRQPLSIDHVQYFVYQVCRFFSPSIPSSLPPSLP